MHSDIRIPGRTLVLISCQHFGSLCPILDVQPQSPDILDAEPQHFECTAQESETPDVMPQSPNIVPCSPRARSHVPSSSYKSVTICGQKSHIHVLYTFLGVSFNYVKSARGFIRFVCHAIFRHAGVWPYNFSRMLAYVGAMHVVGLQHSTQCLRIQGQY